MEPIRQLKIDFDKELIYSIQLYLMSILNTNDIIFDVDGEVINEINTSPYCQTLRFISERKDLCLAFRWQLSNSAIHLKKTFENVCPGGLALLSIPICINENTVVGAHCATISNPYRSKFSVSDIANKFNIDARTLWDSTKKTSPISKPILKIAREQVILATELMSKTLASIYTQKQNEHKQIKCHGMGKIEKSLK